MKKAQLWLLPLLLLFVTPITAQIEHATTPEQCRADSDAWNVPTWGVLVPSQDAFEALSQRVVHDPNISAKALDARRTEMQQCAKTDKVQNGRYIEADRAYSVAELQRMSDFIARNGLMEKFYKEDQQGKR